MDAGLGPSLRVLGGAILAAFGTRLELAAAEVEEEGARLAQIVVLGLAAAILLWFVLLLGTLVVVVLCWDGPRLASILVMLLLYALGAAVIGLRIQSVLRARPPLLSATIAELRADRDALRGAVAGGPALPAPTTANGPAR